MTKSFTLLELIFVIVIIAILAGVGTFFYKPKYLDTAIRRAILKIYETRYQGIGYNKNFQDLGNVNTSVGCINLENDIKDAIKEVVGEKKVEKFTIKASKEVICFDYIARVHDDNNTEIDSLVFNNIEINISYNNSLKTIIITPNTGYVFVKCN